MRSRRVSSTQALMGRVSSKSEISSMGDWVVGGEVVGAVWFGTLGEDLSVFTFCVVCTRACLRAFVLFSAGLAAVLPFFVTVTVL